MSEVLASELTYSDSEIARFLLQAQFSVSDSDLDSVRSFGYMGWLIAQFNKPVTATGTQWLDSQNLFIPLKSGNYFDPTLGDWMAWHQVMTGNDQMRRRLALALSEMFVVSLDAIDGFWPPYVLAGYWDMLTSNVFDNFRTLLEEVTLNPAMGLYLNTRGNLREDASTGREPDENYAREIMQLFTIGLYELNIDGTPQLDSHGHKIETYSQADITNLAHVFTGYDWDYSKCLYSHVPWLSYAVPTPEFARGRMAFHILKHSPKAVTFLGTTIPAGTEGRLALKLALDRLFQHHNTPPFFARQMIQRLVTSNPSPGYVARVSKVFIDNGQGIRGDLKAVWAAILMDQEARQEPDRSSGIYGKVREPMIRWIQWARTFKVSSETGKWAIGNTSAGDWGLGQSPLRAPSVFNYYRPGYVPPHTEISQKGLVAPEFQIHNESTTASYINFLSKSITDGYADVKPDYRDWLPLASRSDALLGRLNLILTANQLSESSLKLMHTALEDQPVSESSPEAAKLNRIHTAILLVMACPEYLIQK